MTPRRAHPFAPRPPRESVEQQALAYQVRAHQDRYPALKNFTAFPAGGGAGATPEARRSHRLRQIMRQREGLEDGYPDTLLDAARGGWHGLRIELKRAAHWSDVSQRPLAAGEPTPEQLGWHERLAREGYLVAVSWGWEPAWALLQWYVRLPDGPMHGPIVHPPIPDIVRLRIYELP